MEYRRLGQTVWVRIDRGEEIVEQLLALAERERIALASVQAIGATDSFTVGTYAVATQEYHANTFEGCYEILSLLGSLTVKDGKPYCHLHLTAADETGRTVGGHLNRARVSATCELILTLADGKIGRRYDPVTGLNLFDFENQ